MSQPLLTESPDKTKQRIAHSKSQPASARSHQGGLNPILQLQRTLGNQRVAQLIRTKRLTPEGRIIGLQSKLTVGAADDQYEQEADRVARQVVSVPDSVVMASLPHASQIDGQGSQTQTLQSKPLALAASITPFVQRQMAGEEEIEDKNKEEDKDKLLQAKVFNKSAALPLQRQLASEEEKTEPVQAKLSIQRDISPAEEDKDQVFQTKRLATSSPPVMQRQTQSDEESEDREAAIQAKFLSEADSESLSLQRQNVTEEEEPETIQTKSAGSLADSFEAGDDVEARLSQSKGSGSQLPDPVRTYMEPRFGVDFSHVNVHTGSNAAQMNQAIGAQAFTHGSDIYFGAGSSPNNLELTAHELTHVVQQTGGAQLKAKHLDKMLSANYTSIKRICTACGADKNKEKAAEPLSSQWMRASFQGGSNPILQLQQTLGNQRVAQLIKAKRLTPEGRIIGLQPKLTVGAADDKYEQEADRVARQVVSMPDSAAAASLQQAPQVEGEVSPAHGLQRKPLPLAASITSEVEKEEQEKLQRTPDSGGIADERYSYSTNCGWIDWGHSNPTLARNLIAIIREASKRIKRREDVLQTKINSELPKFITEEKCPLKYGKDEVKNSASDAPVQQIIDMPSGATEIRIGGFEVGKFDPSKFKDMLKVHAWWATKVAALKGVPVDLRIGGLTDCVDKEEKNTALRNSRASAIFVEMAKAVPGQTLIHIPITIPYNQFFTSNATIEGRKFNRGVVLQFIPHASREVVKTPAMESSAFGITLTEITPTVSLQKPLSEQEVLQAALTTFMLQSLFFEAAQEWTDFIGGSSFAEEDLVSNLIGFYRAAEGYSKDEASKFCGVWNEVDTLKKFMGYSFQKNRTFRPLSLPSGGSWPKELTTIRPMSLNAENFSILSMFIKPSFVAPNKCQINADGTISCS